MKKLLIGAASVFALSTGVASAQMSLDDARAVLSNAQIDDVTVLNDCEGIICVMEDTGTSEEMLEAASNFVEDSERFASNDILDPETRVAGRRQTVFLNFDNGDAPTFPVLVNFADGTSTTLAIPDFFYTPEMRDGIQERLEADFAGYRVRFTQRAPRRGEFMTLNIGDADQQNITLTENPATGGFGISILFGRADEIDFGNENLSTGAFTDGSFWSLVSAVFPDSLEGFTGIPVSDPTDPAVLAAVTAEATFNQTANTSAHEIGHTIGLRHQDAIGAIGDGLPGFFAPGAFLPEYDGPFDAAESQNNLMASGASLNLPLSGSASSDRSFSERSAIKMATNERGVFIGEDDAAAGINFKALNAVNTITNGANAGPRFLNFDQAVVVANLEGPTDVDSFPFSASAGDVLNVEGVASTDGTFDGALVASQLSLFKVEADGSETLLTTNIFGDGTDNAPEAGIFDFAVPETGDYVLRVNSVIDLFPGFPANLFEGNYQLHFFLFDAPFDHAES